MSVDPVSVRNFDGLVTSSDDRTGSQFGYDPEFDESFDVPPDRALVETGTFRDPAIRRPTHSLPVRVVGEDDRDEFDGRLCVEVIQNQTEVCDAHFAVPGFREASAVSHGSISAATTL